MIPTYQARIWRDNDWWMARVVAASEGADTAPLNAITQARSLARIEAMGRDLVATILDADEDDFDVDFDYELPGDAGELVSSAKDARAWLTVAQDLWQERSALAVRALTAQGYSLREIAVLLSLSHQRVDQLLTARMDTRPDMVEVFQGRGTTARGGHLADIAYPSDVDVVLVVRRSQATAGGQRNDAEPEGADTSLKDRVKAIVLDVAWRFSRHPKPA